MKIPIAVADVAVAYESVRSRVVSPTEFLEHCCWNVHLYYLVIVYSVLNQWYHVYTSWTTMQMKILSASHVSIVASFLELPNCFFIFFLFKTFQILQYMK